jgi:phosphinothricin acetyltransferase
MGLVPAAELSGYPSVAGKEIQMTLCLRDATPDDFHAIAEIYAHHVHTGFGSFEEVAPRTEEMCRRHFQVTSRGLPWRVAELDGRVVGYCHASPYHERSAYRFTVQDSVYVDELSAGRGIGGSLLQQVIEICTALGYRHMMAVVGDSRNEASLRLHARLGFRRIGQAIGIGVKFGRWVDVVYLQRVLGDYRPDLPTADPTGWLPPSDQSGP